MLFLHQVACLCLAQAANRTGEEKNPRGDNLLEWHLESHDLNGVVGQVRWDRTKLLQSLINSSLLNRTPWPYLLTILSSPLLVMTLRMIQLS